MKYPVQHTFNTDRPRTLDKVYFSFKAAGKSASSLALASMNTKAVKIIETIQTKHQYQ